MRLTPVLLFAATLVTALGLAGCPSTEMNSAKLALQRKDYAAAEVSLRKEVAARPQNGEAWLLLGEILKEQKKYKDMNDAYDKALVATEPALKPEQKNNIYAERYNQWLENYEAARTKYYDGQHEVALQKVANAIDLRPEYPDNLFLQSQIYNGMKREDMETKALKDYVTLVTPDVEKGLGAGLMLGMPRSAVEGKLGKPFKSEVDSLGGYGHYRDKELYVFYDAENKVDGWHYFTGSNLPEFIREARPFPLRSAPHYALGIQAYYDGEKNKARYDDALKYLQFVQRLDQRQDKVGQVIADIYSRTNRTEEAKRSFEASIRQSPNEPSLYINYGSLLVNLKDYKGAIENFQKVLTLSPESDDKHHTALFNLGAVNKNWARDIAEAAGTKPTKAQTDEINAKVRESVKYFEQYRKVRGDSDFAVLVELANLYLVLNDKGNFEKMVGVLESARSDNAGDADYWGAMSRLYVLKGDTKKAEDALKRADELRNK